MLKIAIVHDWLNGMRGGEILLEEVLRIFPSADIFSLFYLPENISLSINQFPIYTSRFQKFPKYIRRYYRYFLPFFPKYIEEMDLKKYDLIFSVSHCIAKGIKKTSKQIHICYCNSPMRYLYDQFDVYFKNTNGGLKLSGLVLKILREKLMRWDYKSSSKENVDMFIANSINISNKINKYWHRDSEVVYPFVNLDFYTPYTETSHDKIDNYFLVVSALVPYKKIDIAINTFNKLNKKLIIVGEGTEFKKLNKIAHENIIFKGRISDLELRELYRNCQALIFPGEEDFGIVPLEAMACGKPVIAYGKGGVLETVIQGETGLFFNEANADSLINVIEKFNLSDFDPMKCRHRAEQFSPDLFHKKLRRLLKQNFCLDF